MRSSQNAKVVKETFALILLPLNPNRRQVEHIIDNFLEFVKLHDPLQFWDSTVDKNVGKINSDHIS